MSRQIIIGAGLLIALIVFPILSPWSTVILTVALCEGLALYLGKVIAGACGCLDCSGVFC